MDLPETNSLQLLAILAKPSSPLSDLLSEIQTQETDTIFEPRLEKEKLSEHEILETTICVQSVQMARTVMDGAPSSPERALVQKVLRDSTAVWEWIDTERIGDLRKGKNVK